ncbi:MAG: element excision factor XisI family protein [Bacteroidota bacterium]
MAEINAMIPKEEYIDNQMIMDDIRGHYLMVSVGWYPSNQRECMVFLHLDVHDDGKIAIQHNGTSLKLVEWLEEEGVPTSDILRSYLAPYRQEDLEEEVLS